MASFQPIQNKTKQNKKKKFLRALNACSFPTTKGQDSDSYQTVVKITTHTFLGAFAKLRKATISIVTSVCPFVRMEQLGSD